MSKFKDQLDVYLNKNFVIPDNIKWGALKVDDIVNDVINENQEPEEWIWVEGYKATKADMTCQDYQYELGKQHDMPEYAKIVECHSGFHLCSRLEDVFTYYSIGKGNRYFKVKALVRKSDYERSKIAFKNNSYIAYKSDKLTSKSIIFESELTPHEVLTAKGVDLKHWTEDYEAKAMTMGITPIRRMIEVERLTQIGYSQAFAGYCANNDLYDIARIAAEEDISMDMKVLLILSERDSH